MEAVLKSNLQVNIFRFREMSYEIDHWCAVVLFRVYSFELFLRVNNIDISSLPAEALKDSIKDSGTWSVDLNHLAVNSFDVHGER